jgi:hypothetical protein
MATKKIRQGPSGPPVAIPEGGDQTFVFPGRVDCSVNSAYVELPYSAHPVLHARSGGNAAGGFNGGGLGNKCILGYRAGNGLPLSQVVSFEYTWLDLNPGTSGLPVYANLLIDVNGNGTAYKIAVIDPASPPALNTGSTVVNPDGSRTTTWLSASNNVLVVNGLLNPPLPPGGPGFVPPTVPGAPLPGGWPSNSYSFAAILADGGLPVSPNKTPALMLVTGDSINQIIRAFRLSGVKLNGVAA